MPEKNIPRPTSHPVSGWSWQVDEPCPYLPERVATMRVTLPDAGLSPAGFDAALARGERRAGEVLYRPVCVGCQACVPLRVPVATFRPDRSQRRAWRRVGGDWRAVWARPEAAADPAAPAVPHQPPGSAKPDVSGDAVASSHHDPWLDAGGEVRLEIGPVTGSDERCRLHDRHQRERGLARSESVMTIEDYDRYFGRSLIDGFELRQIRGDELVAVTVCDVGATALSAVYTYWDPTRGAWSPGVVAVLALLALAARAGQHAVYLGYWIAACRPMAYKNRFRPHEVLIDGSWRSP